MRLPVESDLQWWQQLQIGDEASTVTVTASRKMTALQNDKQYLFYDVVTCLNDLGGFITMAVKSGFLATS